MSARLESLARRGALFGATVLALGLAALPAAAQTGQIVGQVRDAATQRPLEAVQVFIQGTSVGALTNAAGRFLLLNVPAGSQEVTAEIVGYRVARRSIVVEAGEAVTLDFNLEQTAIQLDQIVVTGAGVATERKKLGNTIASIDASALENAPINDFSQMIAGREPGVVALPSSGYTGEGARIRIRGSSSLSQLNEPIVFVDGIRINSGAVPNGNTQGVASRLDDIPPESIERVEILKGAAAATLYGTEASNGVIQIFTKQGRTGSPSFTLQGDWTAIRTPTKRLEPHASWPRDADEAARMQERWGVSLQPYEVFQTDILPELFTTGFGQVYSGSASGGSDVFQYFVSGRFSDENGPYDAAQNFEPVEGLDPAEDTNRRLNATANFTIIPSSKFRIGINTLYAETDQTTPDNGNNIYGVFPSALFAQPRLATETNYYGNPAFATLRENMYQINESYTSRFAGGVNLGFTPTDNFRLDAVFGLDFASDDVIGFRPYGWNVDGFSASTPDGNRSVTERRSRELTADVKGSWIIDFEMGNSLFENTLLFGTQTFVTQDESAGGSGSIFPGPGLEVLSAVGNQSTFENWQRVVQVGGYLQDQIGWNDWVFLTLGGRWDANSAFGEDFSTQFYPKASISIVPSQGLGWSNETFSTLRVRAAVGQSGLQPGAFDAFTTYQAQPGPSGPGVGPDNLGNSELAPEVSTEWEVGAEIGFFNDRASLDVTYWDRTVEQALVARQFPVTGGFVSSQLVNIGEMVGNGLEINARAAVIQGENFGLNVFANGAYLEQTITDLGGAPPLKIGGSYPRYTNWLVEGYAPGTFFGSETADLPIPLNLPDYAPIPNADPSLPATCQVPTEAQALAYFSEPRNPSDFKPLTTANDGFGNVLPGQIASNNCGNGYLQTRLGKPDPDWQGSFGFNFSFLGSFELNTLFEFKVGDFYVQELSNMFRRAHPTIGRNTPRAAELESIMRNPASSADERLNAAVAWAREIEALSPMSGMNGVHKADFIKFRELSLTYRVPSDFVSGFGLSTATLSFGARNFGDWVNGDFRGMDPEGNVYGRCNGGLDCNFLSSTEGFGVPVPARYTFSTRITF
ncbi:MAG TPA: SusC/RagA family TonB-linked outer membrane protein [Longimicrobiales bacterium]|nr:SusC/RagA family TonB-linked outer membrane protein [Longimicrobiales bacterium]